MSTSYDQPVTPKTVMKWTGVVFAAIVTILIVIIGFIAIMRGFGRYQARADARNEISIANTQIRTYAQRVHIAQQQADIRLQNAIGVREAQDEIAKTLTPLYVQFEMVAALQAIAQSGRNSSVIYIPVGANGIPLVSTIPNQVSHP